MANEKQREPRPLWKEILWPVVVGTAIFFLCALRFSLFSLAESREVLRRLSDSFLVPGVLLAGVGFISWAGTEGAFDMLAYGMKTFFSLFSKKRMESLPRTYYDYKEQKAAERRPWLKTALFVGLAFFAFGILFAVLYASAG